MDYAYVLKKIATKVDLFRHDLLEHFVAGIFSSHIHYIKCFGFWNLRCYRICFSLITSSFYLSAFKEVKSKVYHQLTSAKSDRSLKNQSCVYLLLTSNFYNLK